MAEVEEDMAEAEEDMAEVEEDMAEAEEDMAEASSATTGDGTSLRSSLALLQQSYAHPMLSNQLAAST